MLSSSSRISSCCFIWSIFLCCLILPNSLYLLLCIRQVGYVSWSWRSDSMSETSLEAQQHTPPWSLKLYYIVGTPYMGPSVVIGLTTVNMNMLVRWGWLPHQLASRLCLCWQLLVGEGRCWCGQLCGLGVLGMVLAYWWVGPFPRAAGWGEPGADANSLEVGLNPQASLLLAFGVLGLVLTSWWTGTPQAPID